MARCRSQNLVTFLEIFQRETFNMSFVASKSLQPFLGYNHKQHRFLRLFLTALLIIGISYIPVRLTVATIQSPEPQGIFMLGGRESREQFTAEFSRSHPNLEVWISSGAGPEKSRVFFEESGVALSRVHFDQRATDTVTNFTTLVDDFEQKKISHLYLITSDYHMPRAQAIATVILGSHGIRITPITVPSNNSPESILRTARDVMRSFLWLTTNYTGANLRFHPLVESLNAYVS